ncbi:MAG: hypothetical protein WBY67_05400 [Pseudolabrys sp.]
MGRSICRGEVIVFQKVVGSEFEVKEDSEGVGIQAIDIQAIGQTMTVPVLGGLHHRYIRT